MAADGGDEILHELLADYLLKGAVVLALGVAALVVMIVIYRRTKDGDR
ncbi:hypothetical protein ACRB68_69620 [Actinomadura sp. RB68]|uniref:Uncharacterized protein n=1 Tax=Actinomadura macrotermitis TaxID=2585200 RepID=A0A7K0C5W1_9ACTN|nr:hypothetical protein [Actinomadura macrotermitis]